MTDGSGVSAVIVAVVLALLTVCVKLGEVLPVKLVSPLYTAVIVWLPTVSALVEHCAVPPDKATALQPAIVAAPSLNWTVPVGVPLPGAVTLTVAVNVTLCPKTDGLAFDMTAVVVAACAMVIAAVAVPLSTAAFAEPAPGAFPVKVAVAVPFD